MSEALLSNDEVAKLVAAAREGQIQEQSEPVHRHRRVRVVDFTLPTRFTPEQRRRIERTHESFCRAVGPVLSAELGTPIELELIDLRQITYSAAVDELPADSIFAALRITELGTRLLLASDRLATAQVVDRMLGGSGDASAASREPSEIELALISRFFSNLLGQLSPLWQELAGVSLELAEIDVKRGQLEVAHTHEPCAVVTLEVRIDSRHSTLSLVVPHRSIEPVANAMVLGPEGTAGEAERAVEHERAIRATLGEVELEIRGEVASLELPLHDVLALRPGDLLSLHVPETAGASLAAGDTVVHRCRVGRSGKRRAVVIDERGGEVAA